MALSFSQRMGIRPIREIMQIDTMDLELRNSLWNYCDLHFLDYEKEFDFGDFRRVMLEKINTEYFKMRYVPIRHYNADEYKNAYYEYFLKRSWHEVYDLLEFIIQIESQNYHDTRYSTAALNVILEREMSGYRFIDKILVPISNETEMSEIEEASANSKAKTHITAAISLLSDREKPDYRNSIKESISAVEAICRSITGKNTLGQALDVLQSKGSINNGQFKSGLEKIYNYTNDEATGIRHALMETGKEPSFEDAKFMLVLCSAFVNYITAKLK